VSQGGQLSCRSTTRDSGDGSPSYRICGPVRRSRAPRPRGTASSHISRPSFRWVTFCRVPTRAWTRLERQRRASFGQRILPGSTRCARRHERRSSASREALGRRAMRAHGGSRRPPAATRVDRSPARGRRAIASERSRAGRDERVRPLGRRGGPGDGLPRERTVRRAAPRARSVRSRLAAATLGADSNRTRRVRRRRGRTPRPDRPQSVKAAAPHSAASKRVSREPGSARASECAGR
jgi:hypothetical protein